MSEEQILAEALAAPHQAARDAMLDEVCRGDAALRARIDGRVEAVFASGEAETRVIGSASADTLAGDSGEDASFGVTSAGVIAADTSTPGEHSQDARDALIGPYRLVRIIGSGGMGIVYLAEQQQPVRRQVALKIIRQGMDTEQVIARFGAERQALALMDHPNIAKVFDAGATETGRPYFVMELVNGIPITKHCDAHRLNIRERLELFVLVCQALQHAHQKGVIHRDIKPSNVLIATYDGQPVPKVIDFGIAKATGQQLTEETMFTLIGVVVGTLEYMSPEQAEPASLDIDTRSDIYSLGALLYELLTGVTPLVAAQLRESAYLDVLRKIREEEPATPSSRVSQSKETLQTASQQRSSDPERLPKLLQGELDWIVMRALEKDRTRRYETANGFARDIQRYLSGEPVEAGPPSATYRLRKFAGKNRGLLGTAAAFAALLILGAVVSTWQAVRARTAERVATVERDRANMEAASSKAVTDFLENSLLSQASAQEQSGLDSRPDPDVKVRTLLDRAAATIGGKFAKQPAVAVNLRSTIGDTYRDLSLVPQAEEQYQKAYELSLKTAGPETPATLDALERIASIRADEGKFAEATAMQEKVLDAKTRLHGQDDPSTVISMQNLGVDYLYLGQYAKAEPLLKRAFERQFQTLGIDNIDTLNSSDSLQTLYRDDSRYPEAEELAVRALASYKRLYGPNHPYTLREMYGLGVLYLDQEKYPQAEASLLPVLEGNARLLGPEHPHTLSTMETVAKLYDREGKHPEALAMMQKAYEARRKQGADVPDTLSSEGQLAGFYDRGGDNARAEALYKDTVERDNRVLGPGHPRTLGMLSNLAFFYETRGRYADALPLQERAREAAIKAYGADHHDVVTATTMLGKDYLALKQYGRAEQELRRALAILVKTSADNWKRYNCESLLGGALMAQGKYAEAEPLVLSGYQGMKEREAKLLSAARPFVHEDGQRVVQLYEAWGKPRQAAEWRQKLAAESSAAPAAKAVAGV